MKKVEILAPAGSFESLVAAVNAGCDAVYTGGYKFGARANANNLSEKDMLEAIDYVHIHKKKLYLTVNTLLKNEEIKKQLFPYLLPMYRQGLDAVIVQDIGVMHFIHENFPELPIHASTQMTLTMAEGVKVFEHLGITRVVTSRELSLEEIKEFRKNTKAEIESFVHGALCYCYSGQCLMSSMLGGRSGNRGRCAQPCRMPYRLWKDGKPISEEQEPYLLSPKDICTLELIPDMLQAGIDSFKIEGRMKRPEYTALTTATYRKYTDLYYSLGKEGYQDYIKKHAAELTHDKMRLMDLYNRGEFTSGYYKTYNGKSMMSKKRPNHHGVFVGKVIRVNEKRAMIELVQDINSQDVLEFRNKQNEVLYEFTVKMPQCKGQRIETNYKYGSKIKVGDVIYRTKNQMLLEEIQREYLEKEVKEAIQGLFTAKLGEAMRFKLMCGKTLIEITGDIIERSQNQPITKEKVMNQLNKTNTTPFFFDKLEVDADSDIFIPVSKLNELRRNAIDKLVAVLLSERKRELKRTEEHNVQILGFIKNEEKRGIHVYVRNLSQLMAAADFQEVDLLGISMDDFPISKLNNIAEIIIKKKKKFYLVLPNIFRLNTWHSYIKMFEETNFNGLGIDGFLIKNYEEFSFVKNQMTGMPGKKEIVLDYNMYVLNEEAKEFWRKQGVNHFTASVELNMEELQNLGCNDMDILVYGYIPLMISVQCPVKNTVGCLQKAGVSQLQDRYNKKFFCLNDCKNCYNIVYNSQPLNLVNYKEDINKLLPKNIRLDFSIETAEQTKDILKKYIDIFCDQKKGWDLNLADYTKGHFKRGIE